MDKKILGLAVLIILIFAGGCLQNSGSDMQEKLVVSPNGRFIQYNDGRPFFWLGDTGWLLLKKLSREEAELYLENRRQNGFNIVQIMVIHDLKEPVNYYGDSAVVNRDISLPLETSGIDFEEPNAYDYWDHLDYVVQIANEKGLYIAMVPIWGSNVTEGDISVEQATAYGSWLGNRYKNSKNIIWLNGGDKRGDSKQEVWLALGNSINNADPNHLITFHPFGRTQSSTWFHNADWLDFNMFQSGHRRYDQDDSEKAFGQDNYKYVREDYLLTPVKPTIDGEPSYELIPQGLHDTLQPKWNENDMRRYAYWSVIEGAFGHTYGHNSVMQFLKEGEAPGAYGARLPWQPALMADGAVQMKFLKELILSRPFFERVPNSKLVEKRQGMYYDFLAATSGNKYAFVYTYNGRNFTVQMGMLEGEKVKAGWFDPRTGETTTIGEFANEDEVLFDPPGEKSEGNDWVLVLDAF
ncbi:glycoside hydrolase family 140 protein [Mangrovibacterium sp.]|uniref:glycoside hydrolase family 140 protein n=1 Tax=Mangrovibacterium sp. TaxID=1961364 RepID=UPI00356ADEE9